MGQDSSILVQNLRQNLRYFAQTGSSSKENNQSSVGDVGNALGLHADLGKTPEKCPSVAEIAYAELASKVDMLTSILQPLQSLAVLSESPLNIDRMNLMMCSGTDRLHFDRSTQSSTLFTQCGGF
ncbi:unnamed protein product [Dicrocoelium dendriticum]|nr:unnamed protein product [Dicrocoelium dendriticum]